MTWGAYEGPGWVPPLIATPPTPGSATLGARYARILHKGYGIPAAPHQRAILDVAGEVVPDPRMPSGWRRRYQTVIVTIPRQCGKTTIVGGVAMCECLMRPRTEVAYTAQTGQDARKRFDEFAGGLRGRGLEGRYRVRLSAGAERIEWPNGSMFRKFTPSPTANHGDHKDVVIFDEAYAFDAEQGALLEQAVLPTFNSRQRHGYGTQLWVVSTMGTARSEWLRKWVQLGRDAAQAEPGASSVAYFEWAATSSAAWDDPATWWATHPGLAAGLTTEEWIRSAAESMSEGEFRRAYLNQEAVGAGGAIPTEWWAAAADPGSEIAGEVTLALDLSWDRTRATLAAAGIRADGRLHVEVVEVREGTAGIVERCAELQRRWRSAIVLDPVGPAATLAGQLERARVRVDRLTWADVASACALVWDSLRDGRIRHRGQPALDLAAGGAERRPVGDRWAWDRKRSSSDVGPLIAATLAAHRASAVRARAVSRSVRG